MKAVGIVAEYNPFHNGHLHHLQETKKLTGLPAIAVMSGSFMQRGEPAFLDKCLRESGILCDFFRYAFYNIWDSVFIVNAMSHKSIFVLSDKF